MNPRLLNSCFAAFEVTPLEEREENDCSILKEREEEDYSIPTEMEEDNKFPRGKKEGERVLQFPEGKEGS